MVPPNGPESIAKQMALLIEERVDNIIWEIMSRRRSDSNELPDFPMEKPDLGATKRAITEDGLKMWGRAA